MGTSVMKSSCVVAALVMVVVLLGTCASGASAALRVYNGIEAENLTVLHPPGCCNYCTAEICPAVCEVCKDVVVMSRKEVTLESKVGPYPLESFHIRVQDEFYCVPENDLKYLTATAILRVGPGDCGKAFPFDIRGVVVNDSDRFDTCLRLCADRKGP